MNVKELKEIIKNLPDSVEVVVREYNGCQHVVLPSKAKVYEKGQKIDFFNGSRHEGVDDKTGRTNKKILFIVDSND